MSSPLTPNYFWIVSDPFHPLFFGVTGTISIVTNHLLIYALFASKNAEIGHYRHLLVCFALCDMATSAMHFVALPHIHMTAVGKLATALTFVYIATYYQTFLILSYHFLYRVRVLSRGHSPFNSWKPFHWYLLGVSVNILYIGSFMWACWYTFMSSDYSRQYAPNSFVNLYHKDARDPDVGYLVITWKRANLVSGVLEWHLPSVIAMSVCIGLFTATSAVITVSIVLISRSIKASDLAPRTRKMQQQLFRALLIQTAAPCLFSYIPLAAILLFPLTGIDLGALGTVLIMTTALFPSLDAILVVLFIPRLRYAVCRAFRIPYEDSSTAQGYSVPYSLNQIVQRPMTGAKVSPTPH